ncbi:MAG: virulence factor SrfB [Terracidiphilus sp.]
MQLPKWLRLNETKKAKLAPGETQNLILQVQDPLQQVMTGPIAVITEAGSGHAQLLVIDRAPKLECDPPRVQAWVAPDGKRSRNRVTLRPVSGLLIVHKVNIVGSRLSADAKIAPGGECVGEGQDLDVEISMDGVPRSAIETHINTELEVEYESPHGVEKTRARLEVDMRRPPQLRWSGEFSQPQERWQSSGQRLNFELHNQSEDGRETGLNNGTLVVEQAELLAGTLSGISIQRLTQLPIEIEGGASRIVEFDLDLSSLQGQPPVLASLGLRVATNLPVREWKAPLKVRPMPLYDGVAAIDFGSSNSCCAVWSLGNEPELLALDEDKAVVSPTAVRYLTLETTPPGIETGARVKRLAAEYPDIAASTADRLKQRLSDVEQQLSIRPEKDARWVERRASEVAADYLRNVRHAAEKAKGAALRDFILTHPARCSLRQFSRLREALAQAFGSNDGRVRFMQEPIAALIDFFVERAGRTNGKDYTVASFDLGGGTTDIALVRVQHEIDREQVRILPQVLYCRGERFGGEDLTDYLANELAARCQKHLSRSGKSNASVLIAEGMVGAAEHDIRLNRAELRSVANQFKASLSQEGKEARNQVPKEVQLRVLDDGQTRTETIVFAHIEGDQFASKSLTQMFLEFAREQIQMRAKTLRKAVEDTGSTLDIIQISGKTTYLSVVREAIEAELPNVAIERAAKPKECVVTGACQSRALHRGSVVIELDTNTQRTTSTIGAFGFDSPHFQPIFKVDQVIPVEGLAGQLARAWDGNEPVVLWEDLDGSDRQIDTHEAAKMLDRLGTWLPESTRHVVPGNEWALLVRLQEFRLTVKAFGTDGDSVAFRPLQREGE